MWKISVTIIQFFFFLFWKTGTGRVDFPLLPVSEEIIPHLPRLSVETLRHIPDRASRREHLVLLQRSPHCRSTPHVASRQYQGRSLLLQEDSDTSSGDASPTCAFRHRPPISSLSMSFLFVVLFIKFLLSSSTSNTTVYFRYRTERTGSVTSGINHPHQGHQIPV